MLHEQLLCCRSSCSVAGAVVCCRSSCGAAGEAAVLLEQLQELQEQLYVAVAAVLLEQL